MAGGERRSGVLACNLKASRCFSHGPKEAIRIPRGRPVSRITRKVLYIAGGTPRDRGSPSSDFGNIFVTFYVCGDVRL